MAEHWCKEHKVVFFKKGKMRGYAHPITDDAGEPTGEWCNEEEMEPKAKPEIAAVQSSPPEKIQMTPNDWAAKDKITRKSIERQTALNNAVEIVKKLLELKLITDQVIEKTITAAKRFELFIETGIDIAAQANKMQEVTGAKTNLMAAIKAQGGKEIEVQKAEGQKGGI